MHGQRESSAERARAGDGPALAHGGGRARGRTGVTRSERGAPPPSWAAAPSAWRSTSGPTRCRRRRVARRCGSGLGGIDLLVNNAGIGMRTVSPHFLRTRSPSGEVGPRRLPRRARDEGDRLLPDGARRRAADARGGRGGRIVDDLDERAPRWCGGFVPRPVRGGGRGAVAGDGGRPRRSAGDGQRAAARRRDRTGMVPEDTSGEAPRRLLTPLYHGTADRVARLARGRRGPRRRSPRSADSRRRAAAAR